MLSEISVSTRLSECRHKFLLVNNFHVNLPHKVNGLCVKTGWQRKDVLWLWDYLTSLYQMFYSHQHRIKSRKSTKDMHLKENNNGCYLMSDALSLLSDCNEPIPEFFFKILALGPQNPIMCKFNTKDVFVSWIRQLNKFCEIHANSNETITGINFKTLLYIKVCKKQKVLHHVSLTKKFLKENYLLAVPF